MRNICLLIIECYNVEICNASQCSNCASVMFNKMWHNYLDIAVYIVIMFRMLATEQVVIKGNCSPFQHVILSEIAVL